MEPPVTGQTTKPRRLRPNLVIFCSLLSLPVSLTVIRRLIFVGSSLGSPERGISGIHLYNGFFDSGNRIPVVSLMHSNFMIRSRRSLLLILCFLVTSVASMTAIRWLTSGPYVPFFSERLTVLASQKDQCTLLFIGSSHFRSAIDPILFDQVTARAGYHTRSFNFSLPGMHLPEILYVLGRIRDLRLDNLDWVVVEPRLKVHFTEANAGKQRLIYYHDLESTLIALQSIYHRTRPAEGRLEHYWRHIEHFGYRLTNQGLAHSLVAGLYHGNAPGRLNHLQQVRDRRGYHPRDGDALTPRLRERYEERIGGFPPIYRATPLKPDLAAQLVRLVREIDAMGARPIILFPPDTDSEYALDLPDATPPVEVIRLDDMERYPELFEIDNRWDLGHMNSTGATLTTTALAEAFLHIANGKDAP